MRWLLETFGVMCYLLSLLFPFFVGWFAHWAIYGSHKSSDNQTPRTPRKFG